MNDTSKIDLDDALLLKWYLIIDPVKNDKNDKENVRFKNTVSSTSKRVVTIVPGTWLEGSTGTCYSTEPLKFVVKKK
jgi:hypothetical protein